MTMEQMFSAMMQTGQAAQNGQAVQGTTTQAGVPAAVPGRDFMSLLNAATEKGRDGPPMAELLADLSSGMFNTIAQESDEHVLWEAGTAGALLAGLLYGDGPRMEVDLSTVLPEGLPEAGMEGQAPDAADDADLPALLKSLLNSDAPAATAAPENVEGPQGLQEEASAVLVPASHDSAEETALKAMAQAPVQKQDGDALEQEAALRKLPVADHAEAAQNSAGERLSVHAREDSLMTPVPAAEENPGRAGDEGADSQTSARGFSMTGGPDDVAGDKAPQAADGAPKTAMLDTADDVPGHLEKLISARLMDGGGRMRVRLAPPELGELLVDVRVTREGVGVRFEVQDPNAQTILARDMSQLESLLKAQGHVMGEVEVFLASDREGQDGHDRRWGGQGGSQPAEDEQTGEAGADRASGEIDIEV